MIKFPMIISVYVSTVWCAVSYVAVCLYESLFDVE